MPEVQPTPPSPSTGARTVVEALAREGVRHVFGYPGGAIMPIYDALIDAPFVHILTRHEQGAALAADAYGRVTGDVGVCLATSGPGATNLVTGIANAYLDSVPMVAITGQVPTTVMGTDAFQEVDIFGITMPIVKHSYVVRDPDDIPTVMRDAFHIARSGRPGPVLVDIPKDLTQREHTPIWPAPRTDGAPPPPSQEALLAALAAIEGAQRPLLYAGGGVALAGALEGFRRLVDATGIPVVTTLKGIGSIPTDHPLCLGMLGMHGTRAANYAVQDCDLLICVGARFDDRATGKLDRFAPRAKVVHLDIDPAEVGKLRRPEYPVVGDLRRSVACLSEAHPRVEKWRETCLERKRIHAFRYDAPGEDIYAPALLRRLTEAAGDNLVVTCDVGQHQMWVAQHGQFQRPQQHLTSGGLGTMGYGLPAAIGAQLADPKATTVAVCGDGSFMMNVQELATLRRYRLPVKILLLDNAQLGLVRQWQACFFEHRFSEVDLSDNPDFARVADAFGIPARTITRRDQVEDAVDALLHTDGPLLVHARIDPRANVWPLVPPGHDNATMLEEIPA